LKGSFPHEVDVAPPRCHPPDAYQPADGSLPRSRVDRATVATDRLRGRRVFSAS
jgi:hypothetical protein